MAKIENSVMEFLNHISREIGKYKDDIFNGNCYCDLTDKSNIIESPIEQLLLIAMRAFIELNDIQETRYSIEPQKKIGKFRCDFFVERILYTGDEITGTKSIIVECDSQAFHERTEQERRYEKSRDRFFVSEGYKTFHFTGKEITSNPMKVAAEIFCYLFDWKIDGVYLDSNTKD